MRRLRVPVSLLLGGLFLWAGGSKVSDPVGFFEMIRGYRLLPDPAAAALAFYLPWLELLCGAALVSGWCARGAVRVLFPLMLLFTAGLLSAWARGLDIECGCFGSSGGGTHYPLWVARDLLLLVLLGFLWRGARSTRPL